MDMYDSIRIIILLNEKGSTDKVSIYCIHVDG